MQYLPWLEVVGGGPKQPFNELRNLHFHNKEDIQMNSKILSIDTIQNGQSSCTNCVLSLRLWRCGAAKLKVST